MQRAVLLGVVAVCLFLVLIVVWDGLVNRMLFHPTPGVDVRPEQLGLAAEEVWLTAEDGVRIHGFFVPAEGADRAILFLHGNAGNASHRLPNAGALAALGAHVLLLDYRGYGRSDGRPDEAGLYRDARAGFDHLASDRGFASGRIVVFGRSLGGAVAIDLVQDRAAAGLIVESTFTSLAGMAGRILPPAAPFLRGRFDSESKIAKLEMPLLAFHGDRDEIVPYELGRTLFEAAPEPKAFETLSGAGHNDTVEVGGRPYLARIGRFLDEVAPSGRREEPALGQ